MKRFSRQQQCLNALRMTCCRNLW